MPRPNRPRAIAGETALARRVAREREKRDLSYEALAIQMKRHGCPINASALYRIEKGDNQTGKPRRITVDELMGFAAVFNIPVERLLEAPEVAARQDFVELIDVWQQASEDQERARGRVKTAMIVLRAMVEVDPELSPVLEDVLEEWAADRFEPEHQEMAVAFNMWKFTGSSDWAARVREDLDRNL
jgi:transcriptional regulator with XRE-family HTH domain